MSGRALSSSFLAVAVGILLSTPTQAQEPITGQVDIWLAGRVVGRDGQPVFGVEIEVVEEEEGAQPVVASTDGDGRYRVFLRNGTLRYLVTVRAPGHQTRTRTLKPLVLPYAPPVPGITRTLEHNFVVFSEDGVVERARADRGRGRVPPEEVRYAAVTLHNRGVVAARFKDLALAEAFFREVIVLAPQFASARASLAKVLYDRGEVDEFLAVAAEARALGLEDPEVALLVCAELELQGLERQLAPVIESLRRSAPEVAARCLHRLGVGAVNLGADERGYGLLVEALELAPGDAELLYLAGVVAARLGDVGAATAHLEQLLASSPSGPRVEEARRLLAELAAAEHETEQGAGP